MTITALPTPPARSMSSDAFVTAADNFLGALPTMVTQMNTDISTVNTQYTSTITNANSASASATAASASAQSANSASGAAKWVSGTTYSEGTVVWSPTDYLSYRRKVAGAGTTDPVNDSTNWGQIQTDYDNSINSKSQSQAVEHTYAASGASGDYIADNSAINNATNNFTLYWKGSLPEWTAPTYTVMLQDKIQNLGGGNFLGTRLAISVATGQVVVNLYRSSAGASFTSTVGTNLTTNTVHLIEASVTRETASVAGSIVFYVDGIQLGSSVVIPANGASCSGTGVLHILGSGSGSSRMAGRTIATGIFNRALTAADALDHFNNGISFADKWGSQTSIITGTDSTFAGASNWANVDIATYDETTGGVLTITANAANQYCTLPIANATTTIYKKYRLVFDAASLTSTWTIKDFGGTVTIGTISANGTNQSIEFTASTTGGLRLVAGTNTSSVVIDNVFLYQIGATLSLQPEGIKWGTWHDASDNNNNASYPAAGWSFVRPLQYSAHSSPVTALTGSATLSIAQILTEKLTDTHATGATATYTLPSATLMDAALPSMSIDERLPEWTLINLSAAAADTATIGAGAGHTIVGNAVVQSPHATTGALYGSSGRFVTQKTAASTYVTYRVA